MGEKTNLRNSEENGPTWYVVNIGEARVKVGVITGFLA